MPTFKRPVVTDWVNNHFSPREVGLTHPDNQTYVKLSDSGSIELMTAEGVGIIIDPHTRSVNIFADTIKFHTKDVDGLRWNRLSFNHRSTKYTEPTFVEHTSDDTASIYDGLDNIVD